MSEAGPTNDSSRSTSGTGPERPGPQSQERESKWSGPTNDSSCSTSGTGPERPDPQGQERE